MLEAFEKGNHKVSLLEGSGVEEKDLLLTINSFHDWNEKNKGKDIDPINFFTKRNMNPKVISAFAIIGFKKVIDELNASAKRKKEKEEENEKD